MSTTSQNEDKADGTPDPGDAEKTVKDEAASSEQERAEDESSGLSLDKSAPSTDKVVAGKPTLTPAADETVVDAPWTVAAEPSDSVFADRAPGRGATAHEAGATAAMSTVPDAGSDRASGAEQNSAPSQPSTDRPVASAASAAVSFASKLGRQLTGDGKGDEDGKDGKAARKAHLQIARFEPWTVMKFSFVMSLVCFVVLFVAVVVLYVVLSGLGVFDSISEAINETTNGPDQSSNAGDWFSAGRILGYAALLGALNVLLITALATVGSVIYNLATEFVGGVEVTLKEAE